MPTIRDFMLGDPEEYDPGEAYNATFAHDEYFGWEEIWQEIYASSLTSQDTANKEDYYNGLYLFIDEISWRMKQAAMRALMRGEWKER